MRKILIILCVCIMFASCETEKQETKYQIKISNSSIINISDGSITKGKLVLIDSVGNVTITDQEANAQLEIDGKGKFLMPSLWDMHVHFRGGKELIQENENLLPMYVANGVTAVRDAGGDLTESIFNWRKLIESKELIGPYIYTSGPKIDGIGARWAGSFEVSTEQEVDSALDSLESLKVDFVKLYDSKLSEEMYLYLLEQCRERGMKVSGHMPFTVMLQDAIDRNVTSIEHLYYVLKGCSSREAEITEKIRNGELGFWGSMVLLIESYDDSLADLRMRNMKDAQVFVAPTLHIGHTLSFLDQNDHEQDELLQYIGSGIQKTYEGRINSAKRADSLATENRHQLHQTFRKLALKLHQSGVKLLAGSDGGAYNSFVYPGFSIHEELQIMVESGLSPLEALQTATINGPAYFGFDQSLAMLVNGSRSDILILDENPLEDISNTKSISGLILDGDYLNQTRLADLLRNIKNK